MDYYTLILAVNTVSDILEKKKTIKPFKPFTKEKAYRVVKRSGAKSYIADNEYFYLSLTTKPAGKIIARHISEDIVPLIMTIIRNNMLSGNRDKRVILYIYVKNPIDKVMAKDKEIPVAQAKELITEIEEKLRRTAPRILEAIRKLCISCEEGEECSYECSNSVIIDGEESSISDMCIGVYDSTAVIRDNKYFIYEGIP